MHSSKTTKTPSLLHMTKWSTNGAPPTTPSQHSQAPSTQNPSRPSPFLQMAHNWQLAHKTKALKSGTSRATHPKERCCRTQKSQPKTAKSYNSTGAAMAKRSSLRTLAEHSNFGTEAIANEPEHAKQTNQTPHHATQHNQPCTPQCAVALDFGHHGTAHHNASLCIRPGMPLVVQPKTIRKSRNLLPKTRSVSR